MRTSFGLLALILSLLAASVALEPGTPSPAERDSEVTITEPPDDDVCLLVGLEYGPAFSDVLWLDVVQQFGNPDAHEVDWVRLKRDALTATCFDPHNYVVYLGTGVIFAHFAKDIDVSDQVLLQGVEHNPDNSKLLVQLGYNAYFVRGRPREASGYWARAARLPDAPRYLGTLAAMARFQAGDAADALRIAEQLLADAEDGMQENYLAFTIQELKSEVRLEAYDRACARFRADTGQWPAEPWTLVDRGYTNVPPEDLFGYPIHLEIDEEREDGRTCIARSEGVGQRQFERAEELVGLHNPENRPGAEVSEPESENDDDDG